MEQKYFNPKLREHLDNISDAMMEDILSMSDDEIVEEFKLMGLDPELEAMETRKLFKKTQFKVKFLSEFKRIGIMDDIANVEWEAYENDHYEDGEEHPEFAVSECISYWEE